MLVNHARARRRWGVLMSGLTLVMAVLAGCAAPEPRDLTAFRQAAPRAILVLPPLNESPEVEATWGFLSTVSRPLAEQGYYVFPVGVIDQLMKANGLPTAGEMHDVPVSKLREVTGADAVLYVTVKQYGNQFQLFSTVARVSLEARLVDARTGEPLWSGKATAENQSGSSSGGLLEKLVVAAITQAVAASTDASRPVAADANWQLITSPDRGLPPGPMHRESTAKP